MSRCVRAGLLLLVGILAAICTARAESVEIVYSLDAEVRQLHLHADLRAGGRLLMRAVSAADGGRRLVLERVLDSPWKLYRIDPAGPVGSETKFATVVTLEAGTWEALDAARARARRRAAEEAGRWRHAVREQPRLDGVFAFVVLGPARDRFRVEIGPNGRLRRVDNELTDDWRSGPFAQFTGPAWLEPASRGYWFWNEGEPAPPAWEPHTIHALAKALQLLSLPTRAADLSAPWSNVEERALGVLARLAPRVPRIAAVTDRQPVRRGERDRGDGLREVRLARHGRVSAAERLQILAPGETLPRSDRMRVRIRRPEARLDLTVGYAPSGEASGSAEAGERR